MRVGRLEFGKIQFFGPQGWTNLNHLCGEWSFVKGACNCRILSLGPLYFTWLAKDCKCNLCNKYECECSADWENE